MFIFYTLFYLVSLILLLPYEFFKRKPSIRSKWLKEKFGIIKLNNNKNYIWIHAVSVGEVNAVIPLIKLIQKNLPQYEIILSTITDTGQAVANKHFKDVLITYLPFDISFFIKRAMSSISLLLIMETELWPNLLKTVGNLSVPIVMINGRISERSFKGYKKIKPFIKKLLTYYTYLCVQNNVYADRLYELGAEKDKVVVMGNLKFDLSLCQKVPEWTQRLVYKTVIAGSTHKPEEELIINAFIGVLKRQPQTTLIIAPRHPERFKEVEEILKTRGISYLKRSEIDHSQGAILSNFILLDAIGELASTYGSCDIAIMGGSFIKHGGQNPLEPAFWGKAIVCGPHMENFYFINEFYIKGAALSCKMENLTDLLIQLLTDKDKRLEMGRKAREILESNMGAKDRVMDVIKGLKIGDRTKKLNKISK